MHQHLGTILPRILVVVLTTMLGAAIADRVMDFSQKRYVATVTVQLRGLPPGQPPPDLETVQLLVKSQEALKPVANSHGLSGKETELRNAITMKGIRNTELVQIAVTANDPKQAADLANAVAEEFQGRQLANQQEWISRSLSSLRQEVEGQRQKVALFKKTVEQIRLEAGILDLNPEAMEDSKPLREAIEGIKRRLAGLRAKEEKLSALSDAQVVDEISRGTDFGGSLDATMSEIGGNLQAARAKEAELTASGLGSDDPNLKSLRTKQAVMTKQLTDLVPILRKRLETELRAEEAKIKALEQMATEPRPEVEFREKYREAKKKYLEERRVLEEAELKFATEQMDTSMPRSPVVIWERAEPPAFPDSRPGVMLALGVLLGLIVGVALAFLPHPGITAGVVLVLLAAASFPRWASSAPASFPTPSSSPPPTPKSFVARISVGGDVKTPQLLDYAPDLTVLRVINAAGGFTEYANRKKVRLLRDGKVQVIDVTSIVADPSKDVPLEPGDGIEVPQSFW